MDATPNRSDENAIPFSIAEVHRSAWPYDPRARVLGVGVSATTMEGALAQMTMAIRQRHKGYVCATGVHGVIESQRDLQLKRMLNNAMLNLPDGRPMMWVGRLQGFSAMQQVTGPDFMLAVCNMSAAHGFTHFLYGGVDGTAEALKRALEAKCPGVRIVGTYTPPFRPLSQSEEVELASLISRLRPDIFWIGLSTPKQERFAANYLDRLDTTVMVAVGAAFDLHTGRMKDAPMWLKRAGLQWLHRLCQEPRRLWRRYLLNNPKFIANMALQFLGWRDYELR